jgi:ATP-dependent helicase/nuclease subunit B
LHACADAREEALRAARWARARLEANPAARIAIVVPDLQAMRAGLVQALDSVLLAPALQPEAWQRPRPYNLSLGMPLADHALVQCAFDGLALLHRETSLESVSRLLRSPFLAGWEEEGAARALLDARLRRSGELQLTLHSLHYEARQEDRSWHCPLLAARLARLLETRKTLMSRRSPGAWVEAFSAWLRELGWAQGRTLSSAEYQTRQAWRELLAGLAGLEPLEPGLDMGAALRRLQRLAAARLFQPETPDVPLQVLGVLETSGLQFDHLWLMGLHDGVWPAAPRPNPFLPLALQRELGLPHASAERELAVAQRSTARLLGSAGEVVVSVPRNEGDRALRPSPLLDPLPRVAIEDLDLWAEPLWCERLFAARGGEILARDPAPPVRDARARGGSLVFKHQAACPFRAFAELRLGAQPLEQAEIGLDARTRGSLLHRILERVWQALGSQAGLLGKPEDELRTLVGGVVEQELERIGWRHPLTLTPRFREVEAERLQRLVLEWLDLERARAPFVSVEPEKEYLVHLGGVEVRIKVDRIDTLEDGRKLLIDYKTGKVAARQWFGERPEEPQLPLYSTALAEPVAGLLFAQLQTGGLGFNGVLEEAGLVPGVKAWSQLKQSRELPGWEALLADWRATLETLGAAFCAGEARVDPRDYPDTCRYCTLTPLCRVQERTPLAVTEDDDD